MYYFKDSAGGFYSVANLSIQLPFGCIQITDIEANMLRSVQPPPTPMEQIRTLEQAHDDSQRKLNRQAAIDTALTIASRAPAAAGMTRDQVHAAYYAGNRGYKAMFDLETACAALRKLIVV